VVKVDDLRSEIRIADMQGSFSLQRDDVIGLCEAFLDRALTPEALNTVAFALQASDAFELNNETLNMHRDWLLGYGEPPVRKSIDPLNRIHARLISVRTKTTY
jgi:hypothetical protein